MIGHASLIASCGIYCGACGVYRQVHTDDGEYRADVAASLRYGGCRGCGSETHSDWCRECEFRSCSSRRGATHCGQCDAFPCERLAAFANDGVPHHVGVLTSLRCLSQVGEETWLKEQATRWSCPTCSQPYHWYGQNCNRCSTALNGLPRKDGQP